MPHNKFKFNPFTGTLDLVLSDEQFAQLLNFFSRVKEAVDTFNDLPITGNAEGDMRVTLDTDNLYVWSIPATSGILADWSLIGNISTLPWGSMTGTLSDQTDLQNELDDRFDKTNDNATDVPFTPPSGFASTNVQDAVEEVKTDLDIHISDIINPHDVVADQINTENSGETAQSKFNSLDADIIKAFQSGLQFFIDGAGSEISTGTAGWIEVPFDCTINEVILLADQTGSIVIDVWKDSFANYPPTNADSIAASAIPTISSAIKSQDSTLTAWTVNLNKGDILYFNVDSVTTIERCLISLKVDKT